MAVVLIATWVAKEGREADIVEALQHLTPASLAEEGCLYYQPYQDPADRRTFKIFEVYTDDDAVTAHGQQEHFKIWVEGKALPALESRQREFFETIDF